MKHIYSMQYPLACLRVILLISLIFFCVRAALADENAIAKSNVIPYQSAFDDYKPVTTDSPADWKATNQSSSGGGHSGHNMEGMQHNNMPMEDMANMQAQASSPMDHSKMIHKDAQPSDAAPSMTGMDHSSMSSMNHQQMRHENMDHTKMAQTDMQSATGSGSDMSAMEHDHAQNKTHQHEAAMPAMTEMDHSTMTDMPQMDKAADANHSEAHHHDAEAEAQGHDMKEAMPDGHQMSDSTQAKPETSDANFQIIPNMHPAIVHFPIALTLVAFLFSLGAFLSRGQGKSQLLATSGHFTLWLAALSAIVTVLFGWLAFDSGMNHDDAGHAAMLLHRAWAIPTAIGLVLLAGWNAWKHPVSQVTPVLTLVLLFTLCGAIAVTGWLGGEIVYRHGIGVLSMPASEGAGHRHQHKDVQGEKYEN